MLINEKQELSKALAGIAARLDIPDDVYEDATVKYEDISAWLAADDSPLRLYTPEIYTQGSFRLGTVVRPVSSDDEYDIDLVCHLSLEKEQTTQENLRRIVGARLKKRDDLEKILELMGRCWRLNYPAENRMPHFHMDILPAIPNRDRPPSGILLSDRELARWQKSNPKAYADWFYDRMKDVFLQERAALAKSIEASVEEVPEWRVKTPLQIAVQILKRHRDIYFLDRLEDKPASIIITTLAALAYTNQRDVYDALTDITRNMTRGIEYRNGVWWIANPVDPDENFADKWNQYPSRRKLFERWLEKACEDFSSTNREQPLQKSVNAFKSALGWNDKVTAKGDGILTLSAGSPVSVAPQIQVPALGDARHCLSPLWPMQLRYKAAVTGSVHHMETYKKLWDLTNRSVSKGMRLKFRVRTNAPQPYDIRWQVVNTGKEAADASGLRGGFYESDGAENGSRWETTLYQGTHWVEAFVVKDGICVARSGRKLVRVR